MPTKSRKRSAASEALKSTESHSKMVLSAGDASVLTPDREIKIRKPVRLTRARAASIRRAIVTKSTVAAKPAAVRHEGIRQARTVRAQGTLGSLTFMAGKLVGKTGALIGKVKSLAKVN